MPTNNCLLTDISQLDQLNKEVWADSMAARGEPMQIVTYADTFHDFDSPAHTGPRLRRDVPNGVTPGAGVTTAPNPVAREDAKQHVKAFFGSSLNTSVHP